MFSRWANTSRVRGIDTEPCAKGMKRIIERSDEKQEQASTSSVLVKSRPARRQYIETLSMGKPRLPHELITQIILFSAQALIASDGCKADLLRLASIDTASHRAILSHYILPDLRLNGVHQIQAFAYHLQKNHLGLQSLAKRVRRLTIRRTASSFSQTSSLFSGAEEQLQFEKATLKPLRIILLHCSNLEHLSMNMPARVLDERRQHSKTKLGGSLKELIVLLSIYGGDLNEALWSPGQSPSSHRWKNLTHLQLHGPRFRMTALTAIAIGQLPSLTYLALIMPLLIHSTSTLQQLQNHRYDDGNDAAKDAIGRSNILQIIIDKLGHQLKKFLLVCHNVDYYVGSVQKLGPWFRTLHWKCHDDNQQRKANENTQLILVTARPYTNSKTIPEPTFYSDWMLRKAEKDTLWDWPDGVVYDISEEESVTYNVESWNVVITTVDSRNSTPSEPEDTINHARIHPRRPVEISPVESITESSDSDSSVI